MSTDQITSPPRSERASLVAYLSLIYLAAAACLLHLFGHPLLDRADRLLSAYFYEEATQTFSQASTWQWIYDWAPYPALVIATMATLGYLLTPFHLRLARYRPQLLQLALGLALGGGLIVHAVLKDHWGRPRPRQTLLFGGTAAYRPYWSPQPFHNSTQPYKSFACGHCTCGFYFFSCARVARQIGARRLARLANGVALLLGGLLGLARIAQGGHFLTDVLAAALTMWCTAWLCERWLWPSSKGKT